MTRKLFRVDGHLGALGFWVGRLRTRKYIRKKREGKREEKRIAFCQIYKVCKGLGRDHREPAYGSIYGIQDPGSEFFLDKSGVRFAEVETIPKEEIDRAKKALRGVIKGPISVIPG